MTRRTAPLLVAGSLAAGCLLLSGPAAPASAAGVPCSAAGVNGKSLAGRGTNRIDVKVCGWRTVVEDLVQGFSDVDWRVADRDVTFASFTIRTRIERRATRNGPDTVVDSGTHDLTREVNASAGPRDPERCHTPGLVTYDPAYWWSSDATVVYDVAGDGAGPVTWELTGSPLVRPRP
ncbi:hypothetical protein JNUCC64_17920 [Streptomyces sp. JNUCC 64]